MELQEKMQQFDTECTEQIAYLQNLKGIIEKSKGEINGILIATDGIDNCITNEENKANEVRQLLSAIIMFDGDLSYEDRMEIMGRWEDLKRGIKSCKRVDRK